MDVRFDIVELNEVTYERLADGRDLSAFFDKTSLRDVKILPYVTTGKATVSGLAESCGFKGRWNIGIACKGDIEETWQGFTAVASAKIDGTGSGLFLTINGGDLTAEAVLDAVMALTELIETGGSAEMTLDAESGVPVEVYYRPPLSYYNDFLLSAMDGDTLSQLERRLID